MSETNTIIQARRGLKADLPTEAAEGEFLFCLDTHELFFGMGAATPPVELAATAADASSIAGIPVDPAPPTDGEALVYESASGKYVATKPSGDATSIAGVPVDLAPPTDGELLIYDSATGKYVPADPVVSGPDAPNTAPSRPPVQIGLIDNTGKVQRVTGTADGSINVNVGGASGGAPVPISATSLPLPTGAATEAGLGTDGAAPPAITGTGIRGWLRAIYEKLLAGLSISGSVNVGNFPATQPVSAAALPLPAGASTSALQTTGNTSLASLDTKTPTVGQKAMAASQPVVLASDQSAVPVSAAALPLPAGAATEAGLGTDGASPPSIPGTGIRGWLRSIYDKLAATLAVNLTQVGGAALSLGQKTAANSVPVTFASDQSTFPAVISAANSTTTPLAANGIFTGASESVLGFEIITVEVFANVASLASTGLSVQQSQDSVTWDTVVSCSVAANTALAFSVPVLGQFFRVVYTNGGTLQTTFRLQAIKQTDSNGLARGAAPVGAVVPNFAQYPVLCGGSNLGVMAALEIINGPGKNALVVTPCGQTTWADSSWAMTPTAQGGGGTTIQAVGLTKCTAANFISVALRTPNIFKVANVLASASGNSAVWTPTSGKKFRLMRFQITGANLAATAATVVVLSFQDSTTGITIGTYDVLLPAIAGVVQGFSFNTGFIDLENGVLSALANNVLNLNVSSAPAGAQGSYRVNVCGTEE